MKILYLLLFSTLAISVNAQTTWTVMNTLDDGTTTTAGTLRKAINDASNGDIIRFDPTLLTPGGVTLTFNGEIAFSKELVIKGLYNSTDTLYLSGNSNSRHFNITNAGNVTLDSLVMINGNVTGLENGGAVSIEQSGTLFIKNSVIRENNSIGKGGGIYASSPVVIENSTLSRNISSNGQGGGISSTSDISILNSTISGNKANPVGGGIYSESSTTTSVTVVNSTISGNEATYNGSGIYCYAYNASTIFISNSTISRNIILIGSAYEIKSESDISTIEVSSSIIWSDATTFFNSGSTSTIFNSNGNNIFSDAPIGANVTDLINVSLAQLNLQPLAFNGGTTKTMLPGCGSVARNMGNPSDFTTAQNGVITDARRDAGAAEGITSATTKIVQNLDNTGAGSLRQAISAACPGDTIRFNPTLISGGNATLTLTSEIAFSKPLVIIGLYNSTDTLFISGNNTNRHFNITNTENVTLDSLVLIDGFTNGNGGSVSIVESDTLIILNSIMSGNDAGKGGGIYASSSSNTSVLIKNTMINGNSATGAMGSHGGGVFSSSTSGMSNITIENSTIDDNLAEDYGGGVYSISTVSSLIILKKSTVSGNSADSYGGGVNSTSYSPSSLNSKVIVENSTISGNVTNSNGGGIYAYSADGFTLIDINNTTIIGNTATIDGGGIYSKSNTSSTTVEVTSSIIWSVGTSNISNNGSSTIISHGNNIFSDAPTNADPSDAINVSNGDLNLQPLAFNGGTTKTMLPGCGSIARNMGNPSDMSPAQNGAITDGSRDAGAAEASTIKIVQNLSDAGIGSLRQVIADACPSDTIRFNPTLLTPGNATLTLDSEIAFSKPLVIIGLYNNTDTLFISGGNTNRHFNITNTGNVTLDSLVLINGSAIGNGGAVSMVNSDTLFVKNSVLSRNTSTNKGGGISYESQHSPSTVIVMNSTISGNTASYNGGGISSSSKDRVTITIENSTISRNKANSSGGGISAFPDESAPSIVTILNSTINANEAYYGGGGIFSGTTTISDLTTIIKNSTINGNNALNGYGGGINTNSYGSSTVSVENSTISGNEAFNNGTEIHSYGHGTFSLIEVTSSIIWSNTANCIFNTGTSATTFTSNGNNIFSDSPTIADPSDSVNVTSTSLNLLPLAFNGGTTQTMVPDPGSIAIDAGNIADVTDAQNNSISGRRDIGAAERFSVTKTETKTACTSFNWRDAVTYTVDTIGAKFTQFSNVIAIPDSLFTLDLTIYQPTTGDTTVTACGSFEWFGTNYTASGTPTHVIMVPGRCDSTVTLNLTINNVDPTATQNGKNLSATATGATYQWINCNNNSPISGATGKDYLATTDGSYAVIVTKNGCSDTSACLVVNTTGLNDLSGISGVKIYPNPTKELITVQIENMQTGDHTIELLDATGRVLSTSKMNQNTETISLLNFENGMYIIRISNGNNQTIQRIIKE